MNRAKLITNYIQRLLGLTDTRVSGDMAIEKLIPAVCREYRVDENELLTRLGSDERILGAFAEALTVGETYFLRHAEHFRQIADYCRSAAASLGNDERLLLWSAGCASGEEPYSMAVALNEALGADWNTRAHIMACDISRSAISKAQAANYSSWSFRGVPAWFLARYFQVSGKQGCVFDPTIGQHVAFTNGSIQSFARTLVERSVHVILFRNVGIYLHPKAQQKIYRTFAQVLRDDGILIISPTDPPPSSNLFVSAGSGPGVLCKASDVADAPPKLQVRHQRARRRLTPLPTVGFSPDPPQRNGLEVDVVEQALAKATLLIEQEPTSKVAFLLRGQIFLSRARADEAVGDLRRALFLDPVDALSRFWYAMALEQSGQLNEALHQLAVLKQELSHRQPNELVDGETLVADLVSSIGNIEVKVLGYVRREQRHGVR